MFLSERRLSLFRRYGLSTLIVGLAIQNGCAGSHHASAGVEVRSERSNVMATEKIRLTAKVSEYKPHAIHDDFIDGTSHSFDLTMLTIVDPEDLEGRQLSVVHAKTPLEESIWTKVGQEYVIEIDKWVLNEPGIDLSPESVNVIGEL